MKSTYFKVEPNLIIVTSCWNIPKWIWTTIILRETCVYWLTVIGSIKR